jgi:hypothetical protein
VLYTQEERDLAKNLGDKAIRERTYAFRPSRSPVEALELIGQDHPVKRGAFGKGDFERVALRPARDGAEDRQADLAVVFGWR